MQKAAEGAARHIPSREIFCPDKQSISHQAAPDQVQNALPANARLRLPLGRPLQTGGARALPRWRRDSTFGPGPRRPLDRNARARFLWLVRQHRRPNGLSSGHQKVAEALVRLLGPDGRLEPAHAFLARLAAVSEDTVQRALERLRGLGLLLWQRRLRRDAATGWRCEQTSSSYVLTPAACDPQIAAPVQIGLIKKASNKAERARPEAQMAAQQALEAVRMRRMRQLRLA